MFDSKNLLVSHEDEVEQGVEQGHEQVHDAQIDQKVVCRVP